MARERFNVWAFGAMSAVPAWSFGFAGMERREEGSASGYCSFLVHFAFEFLLFANASVTGSFSF
jgi:hypothetical protein